MDKPRWIGDWRVWASLGVLVGNMAIALDIIYITGTRTLSATESGLLTLVQWASAVVVGVLVTSVYSTQTGRRELEERAKPAIRRVGTLLASSQRMLGDIAKDPTNSVVVAGLLNYQIDQLRASVQDWRELLPPDYVDKVIDELAPEAIAGRMSWSEFSNAIDELAVTINVGDARGGYRPDIIFGVYPEGGLVGYLIWLKLHAPCDLVLAPDVDRTTASAATDYVANILSQPSLDLARPIRCLVVDASLKSGRTMKQTVDAVLAASDILDRKVDVRTLVVVRYPVPDYESIFSPDHLAVEDAIDLPFASS